MLKDSLKWQYQIILQWKPGAPYKPGIQGIFKVWGGGGEKY